MMNLQNLRWEVLIKQEQATNGATLTSDNLDLKGYDELVAILHGTTSNAATNNPSTLKMQDSDTTAASDFADVTAFVGDGAGGFTIPNSPTATTTAPVAQLHVNAKERKRYVRFLVTPLTTQTFSLVAALGRAESLPNNTTKQNVDVAVTG